MEESIKPDYGRVSRSVFQRWFVMSIFNDWILKPSGQITIDTPWFTSEYGRQVQRIFDNYATFVNGKYPFYPE